MDFTNCCVYNIRDKITKNVIYVGSTRDFEKRKKSHKADCSNIKGNKHYNIPLYNFIRETSFDSYEFIPVKYLSLNNNLELRTEEQNEINKYSNLLNDQDAIPNMEKRKEKKKIYMEKNKEHISEHKKEKYQEHKEELKDYRDNNKELFRDRNKKNYDKNRDYYIERQRLYRTENRDKMNEKKREKITCECGCVCNRSNKSEHLKSKKHLDNIEKV